MIYVKDLINICDGILLTGNPLIVLDNFSKDTRTLENGDIYVGIKGENFDGNNLYEDAINKGCKGLILNDYVKIDKDKYKDVFIVLVKDTIECLQKLATYKRSLYNIPVVGVTGSVGKTSTKDIIASVLSKKYNVLKTEGNYNNHIGVPLTILKLKDHDALVIEMGMNNLNEISVLSKIAKPTISVITNVGTAHIGNLGSRDNILKAKLEILDGMDNKLLVINNDNDLLHNYYLNNSNNIITFGINNKSNYMSYNMKYNINNSSYNININNKEELINVLVPGEHFIYNSLCAIAIGDYYDIPIDDIKDGINNFVLSKNRMDIKSINGYTLINDFYNANLDSMRSAINYLGTLNNHKIAVLGDMLELGEYSKDLHEEIASIVIDNKIDNTILVGNEMYNTYLKLKELNYQNVIHFDNNIDTSKYLESIIKKDDVILIKASNGMKFIEIHDYLINNVNKE